METLYCCKQCGWQGADSELDKDVVDACHGADEINTCPVCGSFDVHLVNKNQLPNQATGN